MDIAVGPHNNILSPLEDAEALAFSCFAGGLKIAQIAGFSVPMLLGFVQAPTRRPTDPIYRVDANEQNLIEYLSACLLNIFSSTVVHSGH